MKSFQRPNTAISRREFARRCALSTAALAAGSVLWPRLIKAQTGPAKFVLPLDQDWLFAGKFDAKAALNDAAFEKITVPHCVTKLSWQKWDAASWESVWLYRHHIALPEDALKKKRVFVKFDGAMVTAKPAINGIALPEHNGGYLPFEYELTQWLKKENNILDVLVDGRWQSVPPEGSPKGPPAVDYYLPAGLTRSVSLSILPEVFISDVFAKPVDVLDAGRRVEVTCSVNATRAEAKPFQVRVELQDQGRVLASAQATVKIEREGDMESKLTLSNLGDIQLWDVDAPRLYDVVATLSQNGKTLHEYRARIGFREAKFTTDGFFLNGRRLQLFGLDRHEIFPYVGYAMPPRVLRRDAEILRQEFNCNVVRCSHYPQTEAFLNACDELGLMVWEETPGWGYLGDEAWKEQVVHNVTDMIRRDRNHPAIVIWGVRVNESHNDPALYHRTKAIAYKLDGSRQTSGSMTSQHTEGWSQDVFAMDDYHTAPDGAVGIYPPIHGVPYMLSETVGQWTYGGKAFNNKYRRAGSLSEQLNQGLYHAYAHDRAADNKGNCGAIAWCAFDYGSPSNSYEGVKCPGVADVFRIPKPAATFYHAQCDPKKRPVIAPDFYWDFGPKSPRGPGKHAAIFSNCDSLEIFIDDKSVGVLQPDREHFPHLAHPPFFVDLDLDGSSHPELRINGVLAGAPILSKSFSSDPAQDQLLFAADDAEIIADGTDATRLFFKVADKYGADRAYAGGTVKFEVTGPGILVGDNPFALADSGGVGAVWIKTLPGQTGRMTITATHSTLGQKSVIVDARS